jgi:hypothetical protein
MEAAHRFVARSIIAADDDLFLLDIQKLDIVDLT